MTDRISGFFWFILSVIIAVESYRLELGTLHSPKAGFLPFLASLALGIFSTSALAFSHPGETKDKEGRRP